MNSELPIEQKAIEPSDADVNKMSVSPIAIDRLVSWKTGRRGRSFGDVMDLQKVSVVRNSWKSWQGPADWESFFSVGDFPLVPKQARCRGSWLFVPRLTRKSENGTRDLAMTKQKSQFSIPRFG